MYIILIMQVFLKKLLVYPVLPGKKNRMPFGTLFFLQDGANYFATVIRFSLIRAFLPVKSRR